MIGFLGTVEEKPAVGLVVNEADLQRLRAGEALIIPLRDIAPHAPDVTVLLVPGDTPEALAYWRQFFQQFQTPGGTVPS